MAQVRMKTMMAGPSGVVQPGEVIEVGDDAARALVDGGFAIWVDAPVETATVAPSEQAVTRTNVARKGRK